MSERADVATETPGVPCAPGMRGTTAPSVLPVCPEGALDGRITLMGLLVEAHDRLARVLARELEESCGLPLTWFDVMIRIGRTPEGYLTMSRLAAEVSLTSGGVTRLVDRIVEAGYLERSNCPTDRRSTFVSLTPTGKEMLVRATAVHVDGLERHLVAVLSADERAALEDALRKLRDRASACPT